MKIDKELLKGSTHMLVLSLLENQNMYGYQLIKSLNQISKNIFDFKEGTLYPILHTLESKNYITSYWDETTGKRRKYYSITKDGRKHLQSKKEEWDNFCTGINMILKRNLYGY